MNKKRLVPLFIIDADKFLPPWSDYFSEGFLVKSISKKIVLAVCFSMMTSFAASNAVVSSFASVTSAAPN